LKARAITDNNPYRPNDLVTRAEMAAFLWRFAGKPSSSRTCGFLDEPQIQGWAQEAACWLKATGITTNNPYQPRDLVLRGAMALFLYRTGGAQNIWVADQGR
jgi:hypothetical protein